MCEDAFHDDHEDDISVIKKMQTIIVEQTTEICK